MHLSKGSCTCEYCGLYFKRRESYYRHMRIKHAHVARKDYKPLKGGVSDPRFAGNKEARKQAEKGESIEGDKKDEDADDRANLKNEEGKRDNKAERVEELNLQQEAVQASESGSQETHNDFSEDGALVKALTKLQQTISQVTSSSQPASKTTESVLPVSLYESDKGGLLQEADMSCVQEDKKVEENTGLYLVVKSCESPSPEAGLGEKVTPQDHEVPEDEDQVADPNILIMKMANVDTFITLNTTEEDTPSNQVSAGDQTLVSVPEEQALESESCHTLVPVVEETIAASVSPGPMLGNQSLISMRGDADIFAKQLLIPSAVRSQAPASKSSPVNSFISIESLLSLPSTSSSSSILNSDSISTSLATQPIANWQQSSVTHSNNLTSTNFLQGVKFGTHSDIKFGTHDGVKFNSHVAPKQATNFSNVSSLAMPSSSSGIERSLNNPLFEPHQPAGQTIDLSFLSKPMLDSSFKSLQQSTVGMQQFVPIAPLPHIPTTTI